MRVLPAVLAALLVGSPQLQALALDGEIAAGLEVLIDEQTEGVTPGLAVGIVREGEIAFTRYAGYANLDHAVPITAKTRFNIASNAKQFTALMALDLAARDRISLDAEFRTYLPDALPGIAETITVRQLIEHRSGVRDYSDLVGMRGDTWYLERLRNREVMALLNRQESLNFPPGSDYGYSNSNYVLLAEMIAAVSGQAFHEYASEFFAARGMESTGVRRRHGVIVPDMARAYGNWSGWLEDPSIANLHGDGFLWTTLEDQLHWERQIQGVGQSLPAALIEQSQARAEEGDYGVGLEHGSYRGLDTIYHVGSTGGYNAYVLRFPSERTAIVVMTNSTEIGVVALGNEIADRLFADFSAGETTYPAGPDEIGPKPVLEEMEGLYELDSGTLVRLAVEDGVLRREIEGRDPVQLLPEGGNVFAYETIPDLKLVWTKPEGEAPATFTLHMSTQPPSTALRLTEVPVDSAYFDDLEGRYVNAETDAFFELRHEGDGKVVLFRNRRDRDARLIARDDLRSGRLQLSRETRPGRGGDGDGGESRTESGDRVRADRDRPDQRSKMIPGRGSGVAAAGSRQRGRGSGVAAAGPRRRWHDTLSHRYKTT